jgi:hypothetical protein
MWCTQSRPWARQWRRFCILIAWRKEGQIWWWVGPEQEQCKHYGKYGHWAKDCRTKPKAEAHVAQTEEDNEPTLLMTCASVFSKSPSPPRRRISNFDQAAATPCYRGERIRAARWRN